MMRLIDAEAVEEAVRNYAHEQVDKGDTEIDKYAEILRIIDRQPTVDAEPVVHAKWEHIIDQKPVYDEHDIETIIEEPKTRCSHCKKTNKQYEPPYCPHCGAKMDKEEKSNENNKI